MKDAKKLVEQIDKLLSEPDMEISDDARIAVVMLFEHVYLNKPLEKEIEEGWRKLGYPMSDGRLISNPKNAITEIVLMALKWMALREEEKIFQQEQIKDTLNTPEKNEIL